jgi:hypothetical protein
MITGLQRSVVWLEDSGAELADVELAEGRLTAVGTTIGADPLPYRLGYQLVTGDDYVTVMLRVRTNGAGWRRSVELRRDPDGAWHAEAESEGHLDAAPPGGDLASCRGSLDCDLARSPITNTMPVLRHGLLTPGEPIELVMPWVSVPSLAVRPLAQRYAHVRREGNMSVVRFESHGFSADVTFDDDGLVVEYPGIAHRVGG